MIAQPAMSFRLFGICITQEYLCPSMHYAKPNFVAPRIASASFSLKHVQKICNTQEGRIRTHSLTGWDLQDTGQQEPAPAAGKLSLQDAADAQPDSLGGPQSAVQSLPTRQATDSASSGLSSTPPAAASTLPTAEADSRSPNALPAEQGKAGHEPHAASTGMIQDDAAAASSREEDLQTGTETSEARCCEIPHSISMHFASAVR